MNIKPLLRPRPLKPGSTLGIFTPSSPSHVKTRDKYLYGIEVLKRMGFRTKEGSLTASQNIQGYRSGSPEDRAKEFMELIRDPEVGGLIATVGGSNSSSMIPYLDFDEIRKARKVICGYSDVTSLHLAILAYSGLSTFYGPAVMPSFGEWPDVLPETKESFLTATQTHLNGSRKMIHPKRWSDHLRFEPGQWKSEPRLYKENRGWKVLNSGTVEGEIVVANLNTLMTAAGTSYFPNLENKILLIEEMNAPLSEEERDLRHLERLGAFEVIKGLIVSKPEIYDQQGAPFNYDELIFEIIGNRTYPVVSEFDCGHTNPMLTIAEHTQVELTAQAASDVNFNVKHPMVTE